MGEPSLRGAEFRVRWAAHDVRSYRRGVRAFHHAVVGDLDLGYDVLDLPADPGQTLVAHTSEPGSPAEEKLALLASWAAPVEEAEPDTGFRPAR